MFTQGAEYTWSNGRKGRRHTEVRLDRLLHNSAWVNLWPLSHCKTLYRVSSDHYPIILSFDVFVRSFVRPFKFSNCWIDHPKFEREVQLCWEEPMGYVDNPMQVMMLKLQRLKKRLKQWNWNVFGDVNVKVKVAQEELEQVQKQIQILGENESRSEMEQNAVSKFSKALEVQEKFYKEKAGNQWLQLGDRCTKFFHLESSIKASKTFISSLLIDGDVVEDKAHISRHVSKYYEDLYKCGEVGSSDMIDDVNLPW